MRLIKMFGLAAIAAVAAMAFVGATSASANFNTQLCYKHTGLLCSDADKATLVHMTLAAGTVGKLLAGLTVLCLNVLFEATPLGLATAPTKQEIHILSSSYTNCGTNAAHTNCTVTPETPEPLGSLLKLGLDSGSLTLLSGATRLQCPFIDCLYDLNGLLFTVGAQHLTASSTPVTELGEKGFCPDEGTLDGLLKALLHKLPSGEEDHLYVLS